jgi:5'-3' exonuclease
MMLEVFKYTERVVNMVRPRKLLFMAIGKYSDSHRAEVAEDFRRRCRASCQDESTTLPSFPLCARSQREGGGEAGISLVVEG